MPNYIKPFDAADLRKLLSTTDNKFTELSDDKWIPAFSVMELNKILHRGDYDLLHQIALSRFTPAETLNQLASNGDLLVRSSVAENPNTPAETLNQLASNGDSDIRSRVARNPSTPKSSCFIATAATGSYDHPITATLRGFRDEALEQTVSGRWFVEKYYHISPPLARWIAQRPSARFTIKWVFLYPLVQIIKFFSKR